MSAGVVVVGAVLARGATCGDANLPQLLDEIEERVIGGNVLKVRRRRIGEGIAELRAHQEHRHLSAGHRIVGAIVDQVAARCDPQFTHLLDPLELRMRRRHVRKIGG